MTIAENIFGTELKRRRKFSETVTFACICADRISEINESVTILFVCVFMQPDYSNSRGHEEQSLNPAMPRASTSAAADEVNHLLYTYCFIV